jgi:DNA-binding XRE family transcriptional regulator
MHRLELSRDDAQRLVHDLERRHAPIADHFQSGAGCWLQRLDSDMAEIVLLGLVKRGIPVLPIHDSFIVPARHENIADEVMDEAFQKVIFGTRRAPRISSLEQGLNSKPFHIMLEIYSPLCPSLFFPSSSSPGCSGLFEVDRRRLTKIGRLALVDAWRRRCIRQDKLADLIGISRPTLANILAGRFGASPQTAERIAEVIALTPAFERQPFLPGLAA